MGNMLAQNPALMKDAAAWLHSLYPQYKENSSSIPLIPSRSRKVPMRAI